MRDHVAPKADANAKAEGEWTIVDRSDGTTMWAYGGKKTKKRRRSRNRACFREPTAQRFMNNKDYDNVRAGNDVTAKC